MSDHDVTQRFLFADCDVRGELVALERSYAEVLARYPYPPAVAVLLGELMAAAGLLQSTLKFDGLLILQARSTGPLSLLMVEYSSERELRGIARFDEQKLGAQSSLHELMPDGVLTLTVDPRQGQRYQGLVPLEGENLASCLSNYFASSEQLSTRFWLAADGTRARGLLLQALPADRVEDPQERENTWQHLTLLADTLRPEELLAVDNQTLLHRLYHEEDVQLFDSRALTFRCSCSRERSSRALLGLGEADVRLLLAEQPNGVEVDCQFCNQRYFFDAADVTQLFSGGGSEPPSNTKH